MTDNYDDTAWPLVDPTPPPSVMAQRATLAAEGQDPQKAGVAYDLAPQVGLPASIVSYDVPATQAEVQSRKDNAVLTQTPQLQQFIADNPIRAAVAAGQYDKLAKINQAIDPSIDDQFAALGGSAPAGDLGELGSMMAEPAVSGVAHGWQERQYGVLANRQRRGEQGLDPQLQEMERGLATPEDRGFFGGLVNSLGSFVGNIGASAAASWPSMAAGAAVGEALGPLGAAGGMAAGLGVGILKDQFDVQAGSLYRELGNRTSLTGEPIPEDVKQVAALGYATASTMLMAVGGTAMHAGVGAVLKDATLRALAEPGVIAALKRLTLKAGFGSAEFGLLNAGIEASHIVATEAAKIGSGSDWNTILNDPATRDQAAGQLGSAIKNGLIFGAILPFTPLGSNPLRDKMAVVQTKYEAEKRERIHQAATDASENMSPQLVADYLHQNLGLEDVKVPAEEVAKRRDEFGYVRDLDQQLETQLPLGGDVTIPAADYYARTSPETHTALNEKIRGPSGLTLEEANELEKNPPDYPVVYHGSPHSFEAFDIGKIGTGEGAQAYGHGLYFAEKRGIAEGYRDDLSGDKRTINGEEINYENPLHVAVKMLEDHGDIEEAIKEAKSLLQYSKEDMHLPPGRNTRESAVEFNEQVIKFLEDDKSGKAELPAPVEEGGHLYQAKIMRPKEHFLDWDTPFDKQSPYVQEALKKTGWTGRDPKAQALLERIAAGVDEPLAQATGQEIHDRLVSQHWSAGVQNRQMTPEVLQALKKVDNLGFDTPNEAILGIRREIAAGLDWKKTWDMEHDPAEAKIIEDYLEKFTEPESPKELARKQLNEAGIAGIKYRDAASRMDEAELQARNEEQVAKWKEILKESEEQLAFHKEEKKRGGNVDHLINMTEGDIETANKEIERYSKPVEVTRNFVVFNDKDVLVTHKNDVARQIEEALERTTEQIMAGMNLQPAGKQTFLNSILEGKAAGLDKQTFDRLSKRVQEVQRDITQRAYDIAYRELMRRERPLWKNELTLETARARADLEKRPDILAYDALVNFTNDNPFQIKLDRNEVDGLFNRESPSDYAAFQKGTRASESLPDKMFRSDGISPDDAAERMGFSSGKELLNSLREYTRAVRDSGGSERAYRDGLVKAEGLRRLEEKDNLTQRISEQAIDMALSVKQVDVLTAEMHALAPGDTKLTRETVEEAAERHFGNVNAVKVKSEDYRTQVAKWGREAFKLSNSDKPVDALQALQKQLYNFLFAREARIFEKERARTEKLIQRYQQNRSLENVSQEFTDRVHSILADLDQRIPVQMADLIERLGNKSLLQFIMDQKEKGLDIADTDWLHVKPGDVPKQLEHLTVNEYRQLADTLSSLDKMGRQDRQIAIGDKELDFKIVKERMVRYLKAVVGDRGRIIDGEGTGAWNNIKMIGRQIDAVVREPQYMIKRIDDNDPRGPWSQDFYRPMYDKENSKQDRLKDIAESVAKLYDKDWSARSRDLVENNFRDLDGKPMKITNASKLMMLLNSGNDRNMRLLAHTVGEDVETVRDWLKKNVTAKDLEIAHGVLDEFEKLWPDLRQMTENVSGVSPPKVRARGYDTPVGRFEGGYFPSIADPKFMDLKGKSPALFDRRIFDPATDSRAAHERTGGLYAISFDLNRLPYVIRQTVHDIYMREAVESANRLISDHDIRTAFTDAFGPEYTRQLEPWLQYIANDGGIPTHDGLWDPYSWSRAARQNAVSVLVGGRLSTAFIHGLSAASQSVTEVGIVPFMQESLKLMLRSRENEVTAWDKAMGMSSALRNRLHNVYTSLENEIPKMLNSSNARAEYQAFSTRLIAYFDLMSAVVVFNAKLKKALHDGMSTDDAIWTANRSVDIAHGSNTIVNRPAVMRAGEGGKWFTQFMGFFNNTYNRMRDIGVNVAAHKYMEAMIGTMGFLAATAVVHTVVRYNQKESWQKQLAESGAEVLGGGVPIVRDAIHGMMNHGDYGDSMITTATKGITQPFSDLGKLAAGRNPSKDWVQHLLMSPGFGMGFLPGISGMGPKVLTGHIGDWLTLATTKAGSGHAQFLWDELYRHSLEPPDFRRGILEGNWHQRKAKH
jgi:hypothetical protein